MATNFPPGTPNWVDLGTTDVAGAGTFYGELFGWTVEDLGPEAGGYGMARRGDKQVAGIGPAMDPQRGSSWSVYFATDNADDTAAKVEANDGKVIVAPMDVMGQGRMAVFLDPTGAAFSVWQPGAHRGFETTEGAGTVAWAELMTSDIATAKAFYEGALPVTTRDAPMGEGMTYTLVQVGDRPVAGAMQIGPEMGSMPSMWNVYFEVDDTDATADKAVRLGATEMMRQDSPAGRFAVLVDPQGAAFSIIHSNPDFSM